MLSAKLLVGEIVNSLRQVIGPAISEPYPKAQAYIAATILESVARQIEERSGSDSERATVLEALFDDLGKLGLPARIASPESRDEAALSDLISNLYQEGRRPPALLQKRRAAPGVIRHSSARGHLKGGGYSGYRGWHHGDNKGEYYCEHEV